MSSRDRLLFGRERSIHEIFGGGIAADVILWRRKNVTVGILVGALAAWLVFELSSYTVVSFLSSVLLLLLCILFVWAKAAGVLNRPAPPLPKLYLPEERVNEAVAFLHSHINRILAISCDIALGKDSELFYKVGACLWLIAFVASLTDFLTLCYTSLTIVLTIPAIYEMYERQIVRYLMSAYLKNQQIYQTLDTEYFSIARKWNFEKSKLS